MKFLKSILYCIRCLLTFISPTINTKFNYFLHYRKRINFKKPTSFNEKLSILKLNYIKTNDKLFYSCSDKYLVRQYVSSCGLENTLNELIGVWNNPKDIIWNDLPSQFVLKWNFGCSFNIICKNKNALNEKKTKKALSKMKKQRQYLPYSEMQYKTKNKLLICEKYLEDDEGEDLTDYKVYCFNGKAKAILVIKNRFTNIMHEFFDGNWNIILNNDKNPCMGNLKKPKCLDELLKNSEKLAAPFPFVRVDWYIVKEKPIFGEMTFTPSGSITAAEITIDGKTMGEMLRIDGIYEAKKH